MTWIECVSLIKDLIIGGAAITGTVVAIKGLNTWKRQLKGNSEYNLSRRLLVSLFKYRDAIKGVRHPAIWTNEMPSPPEDEVQDMTEEKLRFYGTSKAYQARWEKVQNERTSLYADLLEAEALWDDKLKGLYKVVFDLEHELATRIRNYLDLMNPDTDKEYKEAIRKIMKESRDIMYDKFNDEKDEYIMDFKVGVENIEKYLKPKLSH